MRVLLIIHLAFLCSCNEQKRCAKFVEKHPKCFSRDTVWKHDTIRGYEVDTVFYGDTINDIDTFNLIMGKDTVRTVIKWKDRIVYQKDKKADIPFEKPVVYVDKPVFKDKPTLFCWVKWLLGGLLGVILLLAVGKVKSKS